LRHHGLRLRRACLAQDPWDYDGKKEPAQADAGSDYNRENDIRGLHNGIP
jgi:hypothetical protein